MNLDDFSYEENGRRYIKPEISLNEQNAFIDNLRNLQQDKTAEITRDTQNLGTAVPSNLGGLTGGSGYFKSRYQTPQANSMVADLRAAAQSQALNTLLSNEISKAKKLYSDAYRSAKKRENSNMSNNNGSNGNYLKELGVVTQDDGSGPLQETGQAGDDIVDTSTYEWKLQSAQNEYNIAKRAYDNLQEHRKQENADWNMLGAISYMYGDAHQKVLDRLKAAEENLNNIKAQGSAKGLTKSESSFRKIQ